MTLLLGVSGYIKQWAFFIAITIKEREVLKNGIVLNPHENEQALMENKLSNKQLSALKNGDDHAFSHLYKEWYKPLCYFALKITGSKEDAEDIVLNMFTHFYHAKSAFEHVRELDRFLYKSVKNSCINHIKKTEIKSIHERKYASLQDLEDNNTIERFIIRAELLHEISTEVKRLPDNYRDVFELSLQGLKNDEIARKLNITPTNVTTRKNRAISMLRLRLPKESWLLLIYLLNRML